MGASSASLSADMMLRADMEKFSSGHCCSLLWGVKAAWLQAHLR